MATFFLGAFHSCPLREGCFSEDCKKVNHISPFGIEETNKVKLLSCIPIVFGQVMGIVMFKEGLRTFKQSKSFMFKVNGVFDMVRGVLTFLGLGILFLFVDVIVTLALLIKDRLSS